MPRTRRQCITRYGPNHPRTPNWRCLMWTLPHSDYCRVHVSPPR